MSGSQKNFSETINEKEIEESMNNGPAKTGEDEKEQQHRESNTKKLLY